MAEIVGSALPFSVLFDKLATEEVKNFLRPKNVINKLLEKLEVSLLSVNKLLDVAEERQIEDEMVEKWLNELKDVVYKASELGDKIKTEALRRNLEGHQSASNITKMFTELCSNLWNLCSNLLSSFDNDVEDELEEILSSLEHLLSQKDALGLVPPGTGRSNDSGVTPATQPEGHQSARNKTSKMFKLLSKNSFDNYVKVELEGILSSLEHLLSQKDALGLKRRSNDSGVTPAVRFRATPLADESSFCGREDIKETIIQSLRLAEVGGDKVSVIPVIGAGGIGKTTLVQIIYDHPQVTQLFGKVRAWVTVSSEFDLLAIAKRIIEKLVDPSPIKENEDPQELLFKLRDALKGKRFLLVLDDVWSEDRDEWDNLKSYFQSGERGSKIIVTTRSSRVASIAAPNQQHHFLPELPEEDCRRLFAKTVFTGDQDRDAHPDLQEIGKKIVKKCKGLPLSVKSVGGILRGDRDAVKWESILKSSVWELLQKNSKNIIPSLWLSYLYLPSHLKRCFAYCSIFPKDSHFQKETLIRLWMAEGFLKNEAESTMEEVGKQYFEELINRSLFQRSSGGDDEETIMMHDLVHDLAMYASGKFCFWMDEDKILRGLACETRHLSYNLAIRDAKKFEGLSKAKRLHTFVGFELLYCDREFDILKVLEEVSVEGACLRVLSLPTSYKIDSLPDSVGKLKHLRYLNLSCTTVRELPHSIGALYNLQTLLLSGCRNLTRLPSNLGSLINLHHLDTSDSPLKEMPPNMCNLKKLHTLTDFVLGKQSGSSIRDLGVLEDLHGRIRVSGLQNVSNVDDALKANLKNKKNLTELALEWEGQSDERDPRHEEKVLEALQPHASLKKLIISEYGGTGFPHWIGDSLLSKIETVHLNNCKDGFLPALWRLPSLKELKIKGFHRVETIDDGFCGNDSPFRLLEVLHFEDMPEWNCWSFIEDDKDSVFPRLKELKLEGCPKLVGGLPNCNTITTLGIRKCINFDFPGNKCRYASLKSLSIKGSCVSLNSFPLDHFPMLNELELKKLEYLVELTGHSPDELKELSIVKCPRFESFRFGEETPLVLERLSLWGLPKFVTFPEGALPAPNLKFFDIRECENLRSLPQQMHRLLPSLKDLEEPPLVLKSLTLEGFPCLKELKLEGCPKLVGGLPNCNTITTLGIRKCINFDFPGNKCRYPSLKSLSIKGSCVSLNSFPLDHFPMLNELELKKLEYLVELTGHSPDELKELSIVKCPRFESFRFGEETPLVLERLSLWGLPKFVTFPEGALPAPNLKFFDIRECENLRSLPQQMHRLLPSLKDLEEPPLVLKSLTLEGFPCLKELKLEGCPKLVGGLPNCNTITTLGIRKCINFDFPGNKCRYPSLKSLSIKGSCVSLNSFPLDHFPMLNELELKKLEYLVELTGHSPDELKELSIVKCPRFESFRFGEETPLVLERLSLWGLPKFVTFPEGALPAPNLKFFDIRECENLRSLPQQMRRLLPSLKDLEEPPLVLKSLTLEGFPCLKELKLEGCPKLVGGLPNCNTITTLGIRKCINFDFPGNKCRYPSLKSLSIKGSCVSLNSFPLDHFPMLNELELKKLEYLVELTGHSPDELKELSIVKCPRFESFRFGEETPLVLERLSLWGLPKFVTFPEGGLPAPNLKSFDIRECENLRSLPQQMHRLLPSLQTLFVRNCGEIESSPEGGLPSNLKSIRIWRCKKLGAQVMHWDLQTLTPCLKLFAIDGCGEELLDSFPPEELLPTSLTRLWIFNFQRLKTLNIHAFQHLKCLNVSYCDELQCLPEESLPNSLSYLNIQSCPLLKRRYRKETGEGWHKISHIPNVRINFIEQH